MEERQPGARPEPDAGRLVADGWRVEVDRVACIGSGMCAGTAPAVFRLVDGVSTPVSDVVDPDDAVVGAAESCPVEAIAVRAATGRLIAPFPDQVVT